MRRLAVLVVSVLILIGAGSTTAATLNTIGGILLGASDVNVAGRLYDVQFLSGRCTDIFDGCDSSSDLTFTDIASASEASQALLDQVFVDGASGQFGSNPGLTRGCGSIDVCNALTPYERVSIFIRTASAQILPLVDNQVEAPILFDHRGNLLQNLSFTYVVWTATPVPEPGTGILMGLGLVALSFRGRRGSAED